MPLPIKPIGSSPQQPDDNELPVIDDIKEDFAWDEPAKEEPEEEEIPSTPEVPETSDTDPVVAYEHLEAMEDQHKKKPEPQPSNPQETEDTFVDKKKAKIKPFGRKAKVSEFDHRKNIRKRAAIIQYSVIGLLVIIIALGVKNAVFPPPSLSEDDVEQIAEQTTGNTGFPVERGKGFATDFIRAYLTVSGNDNDEKLLNYYYNGNSENSYSNSIAVNDKMRQKVVSGPTVYQADTPAKYSGRFLVGAVVANNKGEYHQDFFWVNVYFDKKTQSLSIVPGSPTVAAPPSITQQGDVPEAPETEGEDSELHDAIKPVVEGFINEFAQATPEDHEKLVPYMTPTASVRSLNGLGGRYKVGDIKYTAYAPTASNPSPMVEVSVKWEEPNDDAEYDSKYFMILEKQGNGKYLVKDFGFKYFFKAEK